mmetsp:Transcript_13642/g.32309  ORF Transcript_13642/g.32309 Transcript_13642/m.32309 type:complete len:209 (+) Transcript_13642:94-720(+)
MKELVATPLAWLSERAPPPSFSSFSSSSSSFFFGAHAWVRKAVRGRAEAGGQGPVRPLARQGDGGLARPHGPAPVAGPAPKTPRGKNHRLQSLRGRHQGGPGADETPQVYVPHRGLLPLFRGEVEALSQVPRPEARSLPNLSGDRERGLLLQAHERRVGRGRSPRPRTHRAPLQLGGAIALEPATIGAGADGKGGRRARGRGQRRRHG